MMNVFRVFVSVSLLLFSIICTGQDTFLDTFNTVSYSNNDGTQNWATDWVESNDFGSASGGYISITNNELRFQWLWDETIERTVDLSGYATANLNFNWRTSSLESGETLVVQISSNGSPSTLATFSGNQSGTFDQDISSYISNNTTIRFLKGGQDWSGNNDIAYIDNVLITATTITIVDSDGDGISDVVDLDDDNDGIPDEEEYCTSANAALLLSANTGERSVVVNHTDTGYLRLDLTTLDNSFQLDINGTTVHPFILEFENGALEAGEEYFVFQSDGALINSPWVANSNGLPRLQLIIDESGNASLYGTRTTSSTSLEPMESQNGTAFNTINWISGNNNTFTITNQAGPGPEGLNGNLYASAICDTDGDGIGNELDLDSDNDGIYDIVEAGVLNATGVLDSDMDGRIDGATLGSGSNGLFNGIEDNDTSYANITYTVLDSDSDGTTDPYELDADADGCNDVTEAGFTDDNSDGILGPITVVVDSNGLVTSATDGYTAPDDRNSNGNYDFQEASSVPSISSQPNDVTTCPGCTTTMTVAATGNQFQWQVLNGGVWTDLSDVGVYSGATTQTLTVTNPTQNENNNQYRVVISNLEYVCGLTNSNTATLRLEVGTVITNRRITHRVNKN